MPFDVVAGPTVGEPEVAQFLSNSFKQTVHVVNDYVIDNVKSWQYVKNWESLQS